MKDYQKWIKNFMDSWKKLDGGGLANFSLTN